MKNKENKFKQYQSEFEKYKKEYSQKSVPRKLSKRASESWCNNAWLYKNKHGTLKISGAGRVLLWIVHTTGGIDKHLAKLLKTNQYSVYLHLLYLVIFHHAKTFLMRFVMK